MPQISSAEWWHPEPSADTAWSGITPTHSDSSRIAFAALAAFIVVLVATPQEFVAALVPLHLARTTACVALGATLLHRMGHGGPAGPVPRPLFILALLLGWAICTVPLSLWPGGSVSVLTDLYLKAVLVCWLLASVLTTVARIRTMFWVLCLSTAPLAITALLNFAGGAGAGGRIAGYGEGMGGNPNDLALVLALTLPLLGALWVSSRGTARALALALAVLSIAGVVATYSRGGFVVLAVVLAFGLAALTRRRAVGHLVAALCMAGAVVAMAPASYLDRLVTIVDLNADPTGSSQERWRDARVAASYVRDHPFIGAGLGMDVLVLNELRGPTWRTVHNSYLQYGVDLGVPGLVTFVLLLGSTIAIVWRLERRPASTPSDRDLATLARGIRIALVAFAVAAMLYPVAYHFHFYLLAGLAVAAGRIGGIAGGRRALR